MLLPVDVAVVGFVSFPLGLDLVEAVVLVLLAFFIALSPGIAPVVDKEVKIFICSNSLFSVLGVQLHIRFC